MTVVGIILIFAPLGAIAGISLWQAAQWVRRTLGGQVDVLDEGLRGRIDGEGRRSDPPLPPGDAARVNAAFAGLINSHLRQVDLDLDRYYVLGDEK